MNRDILFRGKQRTNGEWVFGHFYESRGNGKNVYRIYKWQTFKHYTVDPETVGQYTGLTDKNGKKIFEGDIIKQILALNGREKAVISVIEYGISYAYSNVCGICQRFRDGSGTSMLSVGNESGVVCCEVIGNIHDNPELLS